MVGSPSKSSSVEEIWSSWRYEKVARSEEGAASETRAAPRVSRYKTSALARVHRLRRQGEYEQALQIALAEIEQEESGERSFSEERPSVPWYYWEAAAIYHSLKRYDDEIALVRRFAKNHNVHFRALSKRYRSKHGATLSWAMNFLNRMDEAKTAAARQENSPDCKADKYTEDE